MEMPSLGDSSDKTIPEIYWKKRFNVGLTLKTNLKEFNAFLDGYACYIDSFYFSPPLGIAFQTRRIIDSQFSSAKKELLFWEMLDSVKRHGIRLEILFNTPNLTDGDIASAKELMDKHGVETDCVCFQEKYYDSVRRFFPSKEYMLSFNNGRLTKEIFDGIVAKDDIDTFVVGGASIRDNALFAHIRQKGKKVVLLLNNGCSFNCLTCNNGPKYCKKVFDGNRKKHSVEYLYALQSVFPNELRDGTIDTGLIDLMKVSNRSSDIPFTRNVMDSYVGNKVRRYVRFNPTGYACWGRLGHFWQHYWHFRLGKIIKYKEEIIGHPIEVE